MPPKCTIEDVENIIEGVRLPDDWIDILTAHPDITVLLTHIAQRAGITDREIKRSRLMLPSFLKAKWEEVATQLDFPLSVKWLSLEQFSPPICFLPPSIHKNLFQGGWRIIDVYQERAHQDREAARVKLLEPWFVLILALFEGRVVDMPESVMLPTKFSTGGAVEHEVVMIGGALFFVIEIMLGLDKDDNLAQLFLELLSAAEANNRSGFDITRVYGLLTDLSSFRFYSYDPKSKSFSFDEDILVNAKRDDFCFDMIYVSNKIFNVIMCGYVEVLRATVEASKKKSEQGDLTPVGSGPMQQLTQTPSILPGSVG
ncbi:unnamed protein product [Cyclocybe aegerita]|uniref:Uncharacterized protein n=1 Tax=Cyclocybe aegerita TaxID=1973307 RepID=A0A8S0VRX4_CYCAE|nr:unnamed protein product [Cyclocybe aegerita]